MRIYTRVEWDIETGEILSHDSFEYDGPIARLDRSAQAQAGQAEKTAGTTAAGYGANATSVNSTLQPALTRDVNNPTGFTPQQLNDMIVAGEQGTGGAASGIAGQAGLNAARTRNSSALSGVLDQAARQKMQQSSQNNLNIAGMNANLAQQKRSAALGGLQGLYGTDVGAQLKSMGIQNQDINSEIAAGQSGWLQNVEGVGNMVGNLAKGAGSVMSGMAAMNNS